MRRRDKTLARWWKNRSVSGQPDPGNLACRGPGSWFPEQLGVNPRGEIKVQWNQLPNRMLRAARLDSRLYEEVEADPGALGAATVVVILSAVAAGIGALDRGGVGAILFTTIAALVSWYTWAILTFMIGTRLLPEPQTHADLGQLLRTIGFSSSPGIIRVFGVIPGLAGPLFVVSGVWMLVAVRQALDYESTGRAVGVCVIGWVVQVAVLWLLLALFGTPAGA